MEAVAAAAGVGKGTLFRVFKSRDGLLDALMSWKLVALRRVLDQGASPLQSNAAACERIIALLDGVLTFKLANRHLIRARELTPGLLRSDHYQWMHGALRTLIADAGHGVTTEDATYLAHALLAALHIDLVEELLAGGLPLHVIRSAQAAHVRAIIAEGAGTTKRATSRSRA